MKTNNWINRDESSFFERHVYRGRIVIRDDIRARSNPPSRFRSESRDFRFGSPSVVSLRCCLRTSQKSSPRIEESRRCTSTIILYTSHLTKAYVVFRGGGKEETIGKLCGATGKFLGKSSRPQGTSNQTNSISLQQGNFAEESISAATVSIHR